MKLGRSDWPQTFDATKSPHIRFDSIATSIWRIPWHKIAPGKDLLAKAMRMIARHDAIRRLKEATCENGANSNYVALSFDRDCHAGLIAAAVGFSLLREWDDWIISSTRLHSQIRPRVDHACARGVSDHIRSISLHRLRHRLVGLRSFRHRAVPRWCVFRSGTQRLVIRASMIACVLVIPTALICGAMRGIPLWWRCRYLFRNYRIHPLSLADRMIRRLPN